MNKIMFLKVFDRVFGPLLITLLSFLKNKARKETGRILVIRPGGIGDAVLLIPALRMLKRSFPDSKVDMLCEKRNAGILEFAEMIDNIYLYDRGLDLMHCLRTRFDIVIDTEQWHRLSAVIARLTGAETRIGFDTNERRKLFTHRIAYSHDDYEADSFMRLLNPLLRDKPHFDPASPFGLVDWEPSEQLEFSDLIKDSFITIFPGASVPERRWGGEKFGRVAKELYLKGYGIVILGSRAEKEDAQEIKVIAPECIDLTGKTSLRDVTYILKKSELLITADSGLMHIAYAAGTPTVSLFGSGIESKWAPRGPAHFVINKRISCSPCTRFGYTPRCKKNRECLSLITAEEIVAAAERMLREKGFS